MTGIRITLSLLIGGAIVACSRAAADPREQQTKIRNMVAEETLVELGAWRPRLPVIIADSVSLQRAENSTPGFDVWIARPHMDHWHRYVVAQRGSKLWRLAGFAANDLPDYYNSILRESATPPQTHQIGQYLAALTDPYGTEIRFPGRQSDTDSIVRLWVERRPRNWPGDTVHVYPDGGRFVRVTALAKEENSFDQPWVPAILTFSFDNEGRLVAWHRREGAPLR